MLFVLSNRRLAQAIAAIALVAAITPAWAWPATVDHVADGDTLTVYNDQTGERVRVRVASIDAPEIEHGSNRPGQPYGRKATRAMEQLVAQGQVDIRPTGSRSYDRIVAYVLVDGRYAAPQNEARAQRRGLWSDTDPVAPWHWREQQW